MNNPRVIVALDFPTVGAAMEHVSMLDPGLCRLKVGKELFTGGGPALIESLVDQGYGVFLDLKFHDIPNTVARACSVAANLGIWMLNIHASGGRNMMQAAREAVEKEARQPILIGVTVLTSMSSEDLVETGVNASPEEQVLRLARLAKDSGLDGVVCSAQEAVRLRSELGGDFVLVTPGIRPEDSVDNDQKRIMTPSQAIAAGSHYLVVGRPITRAKDPLAVLMRINKEIDETLGKVRGEG